MRATAALVILTLAAPACFAWYGHQVTEGDLSILIEDVPEVTELDTPIPVAVVIENTGDADISGTIEIRDMVDDTLVLGQCLKPFTVPAGDSTTVEFQISFGPESYSALYPVHAYLDFTQDGAERKAHAVRIVATRFTTADGHSTTPNAMRSVRVPDEGALPLWTLDTHRVTWSRYDGPPRYKEVGWTGSDSESRASLERRSVARGDWKSAIGMHPPWTGGGGTIYCDYLLSLPDAEQLKLTFSNAIRDNTESEPPSDGVLFRVWAAEGSAARDPKLLYEKFTDAKVWAPGEADLSAYAGKTILLRLESHPGPDRNTTCDASYWAEPTVIAGAGPTERKFTFEKASAENVIFGRRLLNGTLKPNPRYNFILGQGDQRVAALFTPSERGIVDGVLTLVAKNSAVSFDGFTMKIMDDNAVHWPTSVLFKGYNTRIEGDRAIHTHHLERDGEPIDLVMTLRAEGAGLRITWDCPQRITDFALGRSDTLAPVVYYGHGYRIENPGPFRAGFGGHNLSTSHVGAEFENGLSLLQAVDVPPNHYEVHPGTKTYALHTHMNGTLTLVPGESGAMDCAIKYRPLYDKQAAGGVKNKAGRMCLDIWGGAYSEIADNMAEMIKYGLTDTFLTAHVWQRWGYDYRLPDIWPPDPGMGTVEDMRKIGEVCNPAGIPWGLHDNYIDFYPDAEGYSYDHICFTRDGQPIKAWLNEGREAQSYRWRPDRFMPFLERNLKLIKENVAPTHYFIDVFTSASTFDFYDREGNFHPSTETREQWGEAFAWIRNYLGDNAPQTSEAGHDQLTGWLDGADCQHLRLSPEGGEHRIYLPCESWERVPWFDAVNHSRFILHGVGYSGRYQGGLDRGDAGINSDDYISAEILLGHALMVDRGCWGRDMVRKYWLAQPVARDLALKDITNVEFVAGDMRRQIVTWSNGTKAYVNRGDSDWMVEGHLLPKYGYVVLSAGLTSAIEKRDGVFCESCVTDDYWYCDSRVQDPDRRYRIEPRVANFEYLGDGKITYELVWEAGEPAPRDMRVFTHFYNERSTRRDKIAFQDDHQTDPKTNEWRGTVRYSRTVQVPEDAEGEYVFAVGLYDGSGRLAIRGPNSGATGGGTVWLGTINVKRQGEAIAEVTLIPPPAAEEEPAPRRNTEGKPVDFGFALTDGAFKVSRTQSGLQLIPLPDSEGFDVTLRLSELGLAGKRVTGVVAIDEDGARSGWEFEAEGDTVKLHHAGEVFAYELAL